MAWRVVSITHTVHTCLPLCPLGPGAGADDRTPAACRQVCEAGDVAATGSSRPFGSAYLPLRCPKRPGPAAGSPRKWDSRVFTFGRIFGSICRWRPSQMTRLRDFTASHSKRSVVLDLKAEAGRAQALEIIPRSDVMIENWALADIPTTGPRSGGCAPTEPSPGLLLHQWVRQGRRGRNGVRPGGPGSSAVMSLTGPDGSPTKLGIPVADLTSGCSRLWRSWGHSWK
jgi:hypothetical protein